MFHYQIQQEADQSILALEGDMDIDAYEAVKDDIIPALSSSREVVISFEHIRFVDSTGIGLLIDLVQILQSKEISISIKDVSQEVLEVFQLLQLPDILGQDIFEDC
ncbi:MAG TPA: STAS domain-containing protein [Candidatus Bathyarchaeia archaeon]|nr:STAS domain-containing protein [Candidatus Bathyarchaeia archaeon]